MDARFSTASWAGEELDDNARASTSQLDDAPRQDDSASIPSDLEDEADAADDAEEAEEAPSAAPLTRDSLSAFSARQRKRGVVYISRIPPGMTPAKVRHLLSNVGEVGRLYLQDGREKGRSKEGGGVGHKRRGNAHYTEGWVEFERKSVAKAAADMLNAQPIGVIGGMGGGKGKAKSGGGGGGRELGRWKDDIWTMKYLRGFKWNMLSEQLANERASHAARLRNELSQSAFEQKDYLHKVERARVSRDKEEKRRKREAKAQEDVAGEAITTTTTMTAGSTPTPSAPPRSLRQFTFKQREPVMRDVRDQRRSANSGDKGKRKREAGDVGSGASARDKETMGKVLASIF